MNQVNIFGTIKEGKLVLDNRGLIEDWVKIQGSGDRVVMRLTNEKDYHSIRQLRLLYKCFREISDNTGYTVEEVKLMLKMHLGLCYVHSIEGKELTVCKSISDLSKREISDFIAKTDIWSNKNLSLPLLNDDDIKFLKT